MGGVITSSPGLFRTDRIVGIERISYCSAQKSAQRLSRKDRQGCPYSEIMPVVNVDEARLVWLETGVALRSLSGVPSTPSPAPILK